MSTNEHGNGWDLVFDRPPGNPEVNSAADLGQAIDRIFRFPSDGISVIWRGEVVRVPYVYGVSDELETILEMLEVLLADRGVSHWVAFSPNDPGGLDADWRLSWAGDALAIDADWRSAPGGLPDRTKGSSSVLVSKRAFVRSWLGVLEFLCEATRGIELTHDDEARAILRLGARFR